MGCPAQKTLRLHKHEELSYNAAAVATSALRLLQCNVCVALSGVSPMREA